MRTACPYCGRGLKISNSYQDEIWGSFVTVEYTQKCSCGFEARYSYGSYEILRYPEWKWEEMEEERLEEERQERIFMGDEEE